MAFEFKLPDLGEGIHEAQVISVLISEGDTVTEDQPIMEVETDKAAVEIPVPRAGRVEKLLVKTGDTIKVGQVLVVIAEGAAGSAPAAKAERVAAPAAAPQRAVAQAAGA
ncbi:MAG: biotin/lipoyl-binding protein, partial [Phycisphaerae bacterium]|nr:biotin/lipoyl-binding protein [Phycisphaerae bacterium]